MTGAADPQPPLKLRSRRRSRRPAHGLDEPIVKLPSPAVTGRPVPVPAPESEPAPEPQPVSIEASPAAPPAEPVAAERVRKAPLYWRVLRLRHVHPNGWQRALLLEGVFVVAVVLVLAGNASAWTLLVLPVVAAVVVKANDLIAGGLKSPPQRSDKS